MSGSPERCVGIPAPDTDGPPEKEIPMSRLPHLAAYVVRTRQVPSFAALITALLLAACIGAPSSPAISVEGVRTASPSQAPTLAVQSAAPTLAKPTPRPVSTLPPPAHRAQTIHVLEDPVSFHTVTVAGCTSTAGCEGDQLIGTSRMLDADTRVTIGSFAVSCILIDPGKNRYHCPANTITLTGRGQIVFDETFNLGGPWNPVPWPITSGTGEFLDATGSVTSPEDSTWSYGDFVISITG
jgi:hypothetical protein